MEDGSVVQIMRKVIDHYDNIKRYLSGGPQKVNKPLVRELLGYDPDRIRQYSRLSGVDMDSFE